MTTSELNSASIKKGFVILSHDNPDRLLHLVTLLLAQYPGAGIVIHHDFSQCPLDSGEFPDSVFFVADSIRTGWGDFSLVKASLLAIQLLKERFDPDWYTLLSAADYPIKSGRSVTQQLANVQVDVMLDCTEINSASDNRVINQFYERYCLFRVPFWRFHPVNKRFELYRYRVFKTGPFAKWFTPFHRRFKCYAGSQWFSANKKAIESLFVFMAQYPRFVRYAQKVAIPDEVFFTTIFANCENLKVEFDNRRFILWDFSVSSEHPLTLTDQHREQIQNSSAFFARKVCPEKSASLLRWLHDTQLNG